MDGSRLIPFRDRNPVLLISFKLQHITSIPAGHDGCLASELDVAGERGSETTNIGASGSTIIPPQNLLSHPTRYGQGHFTVALAGGRGFEFGDTLLEICAAVIEEDADQLTCGTPDIFFLVRLAV